RSKVTYGAPCRPYYRRFDPEYVARRPTAITCPSGRMVVPNGFQSILKKGARVRESGEVSHSFREESYDARELDEISSSVKCYRGPDADPRWRDVNPEHYYDLCTVYADTSRVVRKLKKGPKGTYYTLDFDVILLCGQTELEAQIRWMENASSGLVLQWNFEFAFTTRFTSYLQGAEKR
ncbi:uncharacterized protein BXZ73DRAFT_43225, partial [Epithele typhae]|uniref:uncharacterized protein n=1 Tax=Epithele typhae TaxID=378194 RepID=UPI0020078077